MLAAAARPASGDARRAWRGGGGGRQRSTRSPLGIGLAGAPRAETLSVIRAINAARRPVLALDIPSGVNADSGAVSEAAVRAEVTVSFVALKSGLFLGAGPEHAGVVLLDDLGVVAPLAPQFAPPCGASTKRAGVGVAAPR